MFTLVNSLLYLTCKKKHFKEAFYDIICLTSSNNKRTIVNYYTSKLWYYETLINYEKN